MSENHIEQHEKLHDVKITVVKRMVNLDLAEEYRPAVTQPCRLFEDGQEFVVHGIDKPPNFCSWAWHDIHKLVVAAWTGGSFGHWMLDEKSFIACCTDGLKPVYFKVERIDKILDHQN